MRPREEYLTLTVSAPGGSAQGTVPGGGSFKYIEVSHPGAGDPNYTLQILNKRGTPVWESPLLTGETVVHISGGIPVEDHTIKIKASTLAGAFELYALCER